MLVDSFAHITGLKNAYLNNDNGFFDGKQSAHMMSFLIISSSAPKLTAEAWGQIRLCVFVCKHTDECARQQTIHWRTELQACQGAAVGPFSLIVCSLITTSA